MKADWLMLWWNLIFIVPFGLALLYLGVYAMSGFTFGEADADVDLDADVDVDVDADIVADADPGLHAGDAEVHGGPDVHVQVGHVPLHIIAITWLGIGRVPLSLALMILMMSWGIFGFLTSYYLEQNGTDRELAPVISIVFAAVGSLMTTALVSRSMARWVPMFESYAGRRHELLGRIGEAIFQIDGSSGSASVRDEYGNLFHVPCRVRGGQEPLAKGTRVRLVAYNGKEKTFYATQHDAVASNKSNDTTNVVG
jgi:hypothetical protein